jgi:hypothetical protein
MTRKPIQPARVLRAFVSGTLLLTMTGCTVMAPVAGPKEFIPVHEPSIVWVRASGSAQTIALEGPRLVGDTIVGFVEGEYTELPLAQIETMRARQFSRGRTTTLLAGMGALAVGLFFVLGGGHGSAAEGLDEDDIGFRRPWRR